MTEQMKQRCRELNVENAVVFAGGHIDVEKYYSAMDVFLFPSLWEGLGMVAVEAQTNGLHVISSDAVPKLADIGADLFHVVSLKQSVKEWAMETLKYKGKERADKVLDISKSRGWDAHETALKLEKMYCEIVKRG